MSHSDQETHKEERAEEFLQIFKKGAEFTQDLLKENERLRYQVLQLEEARSKTPLVENESEELRKLRQRVAELEKERETVVGRIREVEEENQDFANRYVEIENENNMLANLYIASYQLHSTLDYEEVLSIISEIVINLIGAEEFTILLIDDKSENLVPVVGEGVDLENFPKIKRGEGVIGSAVVSGENDYVDNLLEYQLNLESPMVSIPLKIKEHVIGILVVYQLLEQKEKFADVDFELFTLLAGHAATAIFSSKLYSDSERKLNTIQGFINLMTK